MACRRSDRQNARSANNAPAAPASFTSHKRYLQVVPAPLAALNPRQTPAKLDSFLVIPFLLDEAHSSPKRGRGPAGSKKAAKRLPKVSGRWARRYKDCPRILTDIGPFVGARKAQIRRTLQSSSSPTIPNLKVENPLEP